MYSLLVYLLYFCYYIGIIKKKGEGVGSTKLGLVNRIMLEAKTIQTILPKVTGR